MCDIVNFIQQVGFPIFVAVYLLIRLEPTVHKLDKTIRVLTLVIAKDNGYDESDIDRLEEKYGIKHGRGWYERYNKRKI